MEKTKIEKRIGIHTFGITLILVGVYIFLQTFLNMDSLRYILMLWPLVFVSLGIEVLYYSRKDNIVIKYDVLNIFIMCVIITFCIGFSFVNYGVNKLLYDSDVKEAIINNSVNSQYLFDFKDKVNIENLSSKNISYNVIESNNLTETKVEVKAIYDQKYDGNLINILFNENKIYDYIICDYDTGNINILNVPNGIEKLEVTIYTNQKDKVSYK